MTSLNNRTKLALAAWLETHTDFRLSAQAHSLDDALKTLEKTPNPNSYQSQFTQLKRYFHRIVFGLMALSVLLGFLAVPPAFALNQTNQVNIFWLFIVLLGFHALNLLLWLSTMLATMRSQTTGKGFLLSSLILISNKVSEYSHINSDISDAYLHWQCLPRTNKWLISSISHAAWTCYLFAGWLMALLLLLTNQVNFVWETTLLSDQSFIQLTQVLSVIPQWFGIDLPNNLDILASRVDLVSQSASTRQHWANLLLASIFVYGVLPRLLLTLICLIMYRFKRTTQPLSTQERIITNRYQHQEQQHRHILDADTHGLPTAHAHQANASKNGLTEQALLEHWALFEWSKQPPVQLNQASSTSLLNSREEQEVFLRANPADTPFYILVDGEQSPDRGTRRFFSHARQQFDSLTMVISGHGKPTFLEDWQRLARETQLPSCQLIEEE